MKISSSERRKLLGAWFLAVIWDGILAFMIVASLLDHTLAYHKPGDLLVLFFPAVGVALLWWAVRETVLSVVYGETFFTSNAESFRLGHRVSGSVVFQKPLRRVIGRRFRARLRCRVSMSSAAGGNTHSTKTVWESSATVEASADGTIPVSFTLPGRVDPSIAIGPGIISWTLDLSEPSNGIRSFAAEYTLPVQG